MCLVIARYQAVYEIGKDKNPYCCGEIKLALTESITYSGQVIHTTSQSNKTQGYTVLNKMLLI